MRAIAQKLSLRSTAGESPLSSHFSEQGTKEDSGQVVVARMMAPAWFPSQSLESVTKVFIWKVRGTLQCDRVLAQARGGAPCSSGLSVLLSSVVLPF